MQFVIVFPKYSNLCTFAKDVFIIHMPLLFWCNMNILLGPTKANPLEP